MNLNSKDSQKKATNKYLSKNLKLVDGKRKCNCCKLFKISGEFSNKSVRCRECRKKETKKYNTKNSEKINSKQRESNKKNKEKISTNKKTYYINNKSIINSKKLNVSPEDYQKALDKSNGTCEICNKKHNKLHVDHDHQTGKVRGMLCPQCNMSLGLFQDNIDLLANSILYLDYYKIESISIVRTIPIDTILCLRCDSIKYKSEFQEKIKVCNECLKNTKNKNKINHDILLDHSISENLYIKICQRHNKKCAICQVESDNLHLDHCHITNNIRGLLCMKCNFGLGLFYDKINYIKNAIEYLKEKNNASSKVA